MILKPAGKKEEIESLKKQEQWWGEKGRKDFLRKKGRNSGGTFKIIQKCVIRS